MMSISLASNGITEGGEEERGRDVNFLQAPSADLYAKDRIQWEEFSATTRSLQTIRRRDTFT